MVDFNNSETRINLLRAFAGESQARNRYTFAASAAKKANLHVIEAIFTFTANQEKEHGEIFYEHLTKYGTQLIHIDSNYPVDAGTDVVTLLQQARNNENDEFENIYPSFANIAADEGYPDIAAHFREIAKIEKTHGDRFEYFADLLSSGNLFVSQVQTGWMCLNCGHIVESTQAPAVCPVCSHNQGYFISLALAPFTQSC